MIRRHSVPKNKKASEKQTFVILFIVFLLSGYMYFFSDHSMYFECMKETMICTYSHSTEYNKTMRPVETYNFSQIAHAKVARHRRYKSSSYYTVEMFGRKGKVFKIPHDFSNEHEALNEDADNHVKTVYTNQNEDVIQRNREI